jgi:hypothetical protein
MSDFSFDSLLVRERLVYWLCGGGGALLLVLAAFFWWHNTSVNPKRVFWGAIENNFTTSGVTLESTQNSAGSTQKQFLQLGFGAQPEAHSLTVLTQGKSTVKTENLSLPQGDYTRYVDIKTDKKGKDGKPIATQSVLGVWAKTTEATQSKDKGMPQLFGQVLLSLSLPFGSLQPDQRASLMQEIHDDNLYATDFSKVSKQHKNGQLQYVYSVKLQPILYIRFMRDYAKTMGLHELDSVDPNSYSGAKPITIKWTVDARARQIVGVDYGSGHQETYEGHGVVPHMDAPAHPLSSQALQQRLGALQQ